MSMAHKIPNQLGGAVLQRYGCSAVAAHS
ncbi:hypothetical protein PENARI_c051G11539 [Penicillium arizonense]|uniref:Uncharacterized protein n=1 Tax=Penicillium arizonense TaxID=1835702 RepID=A0A1F5L244_PENAI|nr:hypothetical protein PENARI_c051G11539 [Penicillium arizonense]